MFRSLRSSEQVNNAVMQMEATTQQNAALVEQAAAASKVMQHHAQQLVHRVGFFQTPRAMQRGGDPEVAADAEIAAAA